ncbi:unnamed protein product [Rotaria magnacalcarata]|uniref:DUF4781 domain-containing protein n=1 Tax=Rotaria magnacalcarata TaxID=392030 RepID=A0A816PB68_9BILA|nr:unnamed protein product [Rotaria magnacalcarata]CAF2046401.1 unnamed protein product [Rotaria magnacalcarata]CAF3813770.1 unnamed protein product [Rotaria magnacalcarata]CAF3816628.1 unnamed protein product [Rotaria magnacalcarata]
MDAGGRVYQNWSDYLRNNHLDQGVMIYPEDGTYTPKNVNGSPKEKVHLIASETQSCKPSARAKNILDQVVVATGLLLTGAAVVTAVPLGIFAASTIATISTGSYYIGVACTAYSVVVNGYDKFAHDESVTTELLLIGTTALSGLTSYMNQYWSKRMADIVQKTDVWDDVVKNISRTQKFVFATLNIVKVAMSASSVFSAFWHLCMKQNRTWLDYYQVCISLFFFANVVTKPIFLQQVFEAERVRFAENFTRSVGEIREKVEREEAKEELEKAITNAKTNAQKTYLIRNLQKIDDLDGHFYRIHETGSVVNYTEKGLVINNQITLSPEAYNQMGKQQLLQQLDNIKFYPTEQERREFINKLLDDYKSPDFEDYANKYIEGNMTPEEKLEFDRKITEMAVRRKDQFFSDTAEFKETPQYREMINATETEIAGGKSIEVLNQEKQQLEADKQAKKIDEAEYKKKMSEINHSRQIRKCVDKYVQNSSTTQETIGDEYVKQRANGKTEQEWKQTHENIQKKFDNLAENVKQRPDVQANFQKQLNDASANIDMAKEARLEINSQLGKDWVNETRNLYTVKDNYERNEDFIWHVTNDNTKSSIEEIWGVSDYRQATVNGVQIFKDLDTNTIDDMNCIINSCGKNTAEVVNLAKRIAEDQNCHMKADNAREFGHVINAVRQTSGHVGSMNYDKIRNEINTMYTSAEQAVLHDNQMQFSSMNSAAVHAYKHKEEFGRNTTTSDYLTNVRDNLIKPQNTNGGVYTQDGSGISTNYHLTESGRYRFGTVSTDSNGGNPYIKTMHVRSEVGVGQQPPISITHTADPGSGNTAASTTPPQNNSLGGFTSTLSWFGSAFC